METQKTQPKLKTRKAKSDGRKGRAQVRPGIKRFLIWTVQSGKLFALIILGVAVWLLYAAFTSPQYVVRSVRAEGNTALTTEDVQELVAAEGQPIWFVNDTEIEERVRQSPYVQSVSAQVVLPDQIVVRVTERRPEVRWTHSGTTYAVTWQGLVLSSAPEGGAAATQPISATNALSITDTVSDTQSAEAGPSFVSSVAIVDTTPDRTLKPGDYVDADALEVARRITLRAAELPTTIQRIEWDAGLGVSIITDDNRQVVVGKSDRLDEKLGIMSQLLYESTQFSYLDLRTTAPYYR